MTLYEHGAAQMSALLRKLRRVAGRVLDIAGECAGTSLQFAMRPFALPPAPPLPPGPLRVLVIGAHPDDESAFAAGTIAAHAKRGDEVTVLIVTSGGASRAGGLAPADMAARRAVELERACAALGATCVRPLGLTELHWSAEEARGAIAEELERADLLYTHSPVDFHPDHFQLCRLVSEIVRDSQRIRLAEVQVYLTPLLRNCIVQLGPAERAAKDAAFAAHATQVWSTRAVQRQQRAAQRAYGGRDVEFFWEMDGAALRRVVAAAPWLIGARAPFWGARLRGASDPLAVLCGLRARLRLRRAARA